MAKKKQIQITPVQVAHLVNSTIKNLIDFKTGEDNGNLRFILMLDCLFPEECVPISQEPDGEEEVLDIMFAHGVISLAPFFKTCFRITGEDGIAYRSFDTVPIGPKNLAEFVSALSEIDDLWSELDQQAEEEQDLKEKTEGKNYVEGNNTVN